LTLIEVFLNQKRLNVSERIVKMASCESFNKETPTDETERKVGRKGWWKKRKGLLLPELCLEDKIN
jgi:hypothetical protein